MNLTSWILVGLLSYSVLSLIPLNSGWIKEDGWLEKFLIYSNPLVLFFLFSLAAYSKFISLLISWIKLKKEEDPDES